MPRSKDHIKRPSNAFILFRAARVRELRLIGYHNLGPAAFEEDAGDAAPSTPAEDAEVGEDDIEEADESPEGEGASEAEPQSPSKPSGSGNGKAKARRTPLQADISKAVSREWRALPAEERARWMKEAEEEKRRHQIANPMYKYQPRTKKDKAGKRAKGKGKGKESAEGADGGDVDNGEGPSTPRNRARAQRPQLCTREIIPIESGVASPSGAAVHEPPVPLPWPVCAPMYPMTGPYFVPEHMMPPPYIAASLQGRLPWTAIGSPGIGPPHAGDFGSMVALESGPPLCIDPALLHSPPSDQTSSLGPSTPPMQGSLPPHVTICTGSPHSSEGSSSSPVPPQASLDMGGLPQFTHEESVVLESICRRTADFLAATRVPCRSPSLAGGQQADPAQESVMGRLLTVMSKMNKVI